MIKDLEDRLITEGIFGLNGVTLRDRVTKDESGNQIKFEASVSATQYCNQMAKTEGCTPDQYALHVIKHIDRGLHRF